MEHVDALITERLITFHAALVARGQIAPPPPAGPVAAVEDGLPSEGNCART
jgi:hypothetical protein